uniref:Synaptotagmin-like protein 2 isoform X1 n=1 Tax=Pogona vitticeps TaxID=103695 RepID=A0ABM5EW71_9SAUR
MLDLSFLTEEEYEKLMTVLQRDAELKKKDGDRIRRLQGSLKDGKKKKFVTGEWFHEVKAQRFRQEPEGSDLLRASIKKKSRVDGKNNVHAAESLERGDASLPSEGTALLSCPSEEERSWEPALDSAEERRPSPKPRLRLPSLTDKRSSLEDISPADSGVGVSPFLMTRGDSLEHGKGSAISLVASAKHLEGDLDGFSYSPGMDVPDAPQSPSENWTTQPAVREEINPSSRIPVKKKSSNGLFSPSADHDNGGESPQLGPAKRESLKTSRLPSPREEEGRSIKQGPSYTVSPVKDEEINLDWQHFQNLKNFWEKGGESVLGNYGSQPSTEKGVCVEDNGRPSRLRRSLSAQANESQNSDDKQSSHVPPPKPRIPSRKPSVLSSSEDEPSYTVRQRKGSGGPTLPRSTYARSKGGAAHRNSLSDGNGKPSSSVEEEKKAQRGPRRSRLPIRVPSVNIESPAKEWTGTLFEPETPADEFVMAEESKRKRDSLAGRVQILIESAPSEDLEKGGSEGEGSYSLDALANLEEGKEMLLKEEPPPSAENFPGEERPASDREGVQYIDAAVLSERNGPRVPSAKKLARTNGYSLAKSMVNLYTTTETYTKPQTLTHQYLEPERAKDLSKSSPLLLSETESDTASEISFQLNGHKKSPSVGSHSSGMASVSSVSGSVLSVYSGDFGNVDAQGLVQFALDYDEKNREFQIFVSQCKDLAVVDEKKARTDPYVKTYLLPDKARMGKRKTSVKKRTVSPIYNEVLRYKIEKMVLLIQKLNLSVWHNDPLGRNSFLGEMEIDLAGWDWRNNKLNWYMLKPRSLSANHCAGHRGVMDLAIKYIPPGSLGWKTPPSGEVHIWVKDTKDLPQLRPSGVDSFVKCYVLPDTSKKSYQKTRIIKRDSNPIFNHTIVYDGFHTEDLKDACVELTVWDHEKLTNHFLGGIRLGLGTGSSYGIVVDWMDSTQEEVAFWQEMMMTANEWIEGSLPLRSLAGKKKLK